MNPRETADADLRTAVDDRLNARREAARQKRDRLQRTYRDKTTRRTAGLKARHARKLNRISKEN
ncbi:hypothetical protein AB0K34_11095 [Actinomadura sp. NPDC049382]|uniref:hypothetical protein n=1 Tax=Actinomadura sp. NPDC049382 TaxID=3158220 RepID=UPI0034303B67